MRFSNWFSNRSSRWFWFLLSSRPSGLDVPLKPMGDFWKCQLNSSLLWPRFVPLADWTPQALYSYYTIQDHPATRTFQQLSKCFLACLRMSWLPAFAAHETGNEGKHGDNFQQKKRHLGKKLLSCFVFEMANLFTSSDCAFFPSSDENLGIETFALGDRCTGVSPLRSLGICMHVVARVHACVFGVSVGR